MVETAAVAACCVLPTDNVSVPLLKDTVPPETDPPPRLKDPLVLAVQPSPADIATPNDAVVLIEAVFLQLQYQHLERQQMLENQLQDQKQSEPVGVSPLTILHNYVHSFRV